MKHLKKVLHLFLAVCLILTVIPVTAVPVRAADSYNVWVGKTEVTASTMSGSGWKFTPAAQTPDNVNTLEINNLNANPSQMGNLFSIGYFDMRCGIYSKNSLKIICSGTSTVTARFDTDTSLAAGIYVESGSLTIGGTGTLNIDVRKAYRANLTGTAPAIRTVGLYSAKAMTMEDSVSVSVQTENSPSSDGSDTFGVYVGTSGSGRITLKESAALTVVTDGAVNGNTYAINANCSVESIGNSLRLTTGQVTGIGNSTVCTGTLKMNGGTAELQSGKNPIWLDTRNYEEPTVLTGTSAADAKPLANGAAEISGVQYVKVYRQWPAPEFTVVSDTDLQATCQDTVTLTAVASGDVQYEWWCIMGSNTTVKVSDLAKMDSFAPFFDGYDSSILTVDLGCMRGTEGRIIFQCKAIANWRDPAASVTARSPSFRIDVTHDWTYAEASAAQHTMTCAACEHGSTDSHTFKYTVTESTSDGAKKYTQECVYCGYSYTTPSYVSMDYNTEITVIYEFNGGCSTRVGASTSWFFDQAAKYTYTNTPYVQTLYMTREGYRFLGWAHDPNAKVPDYWGDSAILFAEDMTLYAVWGDVYYGYQTLTDTQKNVYDLICSSLEETVPDRAVSVPEEWKVPVDDLVLIMEMILADHPEYFWFSGAYSYVPTPGTEYVVSVTPRFRLNGNGMSISELSTAKAVFRDALNSVLSEMSAAGLTTEYDRALWLHDKVTELVAYVSTPNDQSAYGALVDGQAVCAGYARLYQLLLQSAGIRAWTVCGDSVDPNSGQLIPHAWNLMWLGDSEDCLYADVTWDDQGARLYHLFFARTLNEMRGDHAADAAIFAPRLPVCTSACADQYAYGTENIISGAVTAAAMAERMISTDGGQTYTGIFYDPDGKIETWIHTEGNFRLLLEAMGLLGGGGSFSLSSVKLAGPTAGTEMHLTLTVTGGSSQPPQPPVQEDVKVTAQGSIDYTVSGQVVTVDSEAACKVGYWDGSKYVAIAASANSDGTYSFTAPAGVTEILLVVNGDVNGDGKTNSSDYGRLNAALLGKVELTQEASFAADVNGDGKANSSDYGRLNAVMLGKTSLTW